MSVTSNNLQGIKITVDDFGIQIYIPRTNLNKKWVIIKKIIDSLVEILEG
jgi:hypothetical protein